MLQLPIQQAEETEMNNNFFHLYNLFLCGSQFTNKCRQLKSAKAHVDDLQAWERRIFREEA
jgi:hypothetical protein